MTFGLVYSSFSLLERQTLKMTFFAPCYCSTVTVYCYCTQLPKGELGNVSKLAKSSKITPKMAFIPHLIPSPYEIEVIIVLERSVYGESKESSILFPYFFNIK